MVFTKEHRLKPISFWNTVIFSDEIKFNLYGSDGRFKIWREARKAMAPKNTIKTVKFEGWICPFLWLYVGWRGWRACFYIDGIMGIMVYLGILKDNLEKSASKLELESGFIFQQDNDPKSIQQSLCSYTCCTITGSNYTLQPSL
ncbi:uncharacterized protein TNCV_3852331 [Trichonephila clavipes]|nr:uncharacterized protein TNCV_3852331 [Trichonephila clavipes]